MPRTPSPEPRARAERGIALLIVVSLLTVVGIMGAAFAFSMYLETQATRQFVSTTRARYLAEAGISDGRALLDEDHAATRVDDLTEPWAQAPAGHDVDADGDGAREARWWPVTDAAHQTIGRYALQIADESGKANLNEAQADPPALGKGALNLTQVLDAAGVNDARAVAQAIEAHRHGDDQRPGIAGVDDDGDGAIDEADEYQPLALRGDDRRLESLEDLVKIAGLGGDELRRLGRFATVYSWDLNVSVTGTARVNINTATPEELLAVMLDSGVRDPWEAAVNIADGADSNADISKLIKSSYVVLIPDQGPLGSWTWNAESGGHYRSGEPGGQPLSWVASVPTGTFRLLARGVEGMKIGDLTVAGLSKPSVDDGESLGILSLNGTLAVEAANHEPAATPCGFRGFELALEHPESGVTVRGIEAIRINELMVEPSIEFDVSTATFDPQGSGWTCPANGSPCANSEGGRGRWSWSSELLRPGRYYVRVFGEAAGQTVGIARIGNNDQLLVHGQSHPSTILIGSDGKVTLSLGKTAAEGTYYLKSVTLSLQPDAEYVELINVSDNPVDAGGWTIEGELTGGRQARLPDGSVIEPHGLLVAAVDLDDAQSGLAANGINARSAWEIPDGVNAVQLEFLGGAPSRDDDWLKTALPPGGTARLILRSQTGVVDEVEYLLPLSLASSFQSIEKGDPSVIVDQDGDGVDDGWHPSLALYTPGQPNENNGLRELRGLETVVHDPSKEVTILNHPLATVGDLAGLPSGTAWKPFSSRDLAKIVDRVTVEGLRLEAEGHLKEGQGAWQEKAQGYYEYSSASVPPVTGRWRWTEALDGHYRFSLSGWPGEQMSARWETQPGLFTDWSPPLTADAQGRVILGQIAVGMDGGATNTVTLEVSCVSPSGICHIDHARLDPQLIRVGPVNINTAPREVLLALPGMTEAVADRIISGRPYGDREQKGRGIGDVLLGDALGMDEEGKLAVFRRLAHLLTVRSDAFQIVSLGQTIEDRRGGATQRILTVVER